MEDFNVPKIRDGITFAEVPNHIAYFIELGDCKLKCKGCHSPELCKPTMGDTPLSDIVAKAKSLIGLGANAIAVLGGTDCYSFSRGSLGKLLDSLSHLSRVALYTGNNDRGGLMREFARRHHCTWVKTGKYDEKKGGLQSKTTNQRFYEWDNKMDEWKDKTSLFNK